jgi:hypothetical protein
MLEVKLLTCVANIYVNNALPWPQQLKYLIQMPPEEFTGLSRFGFGSTLPIVAALQLTDDNILVPTAAHVEAFAVDRKRFTKDLITCIKQENKSVSPEAHFALTLG